MPSLPLNFTLLYQRLYQSEMWAFDSFGMSSPHERHKLSLLWNGNEQNEQKPQKANRKAN